MWKRQGGTSTYALACEFNTYLEPTCLAPNCKSGTECCFDLFESMIYESYAAVLPVYFRNRICYAKKNADLHQV